MLLAVLGPYRVRLGAVLVKQHLIRSSLSRLLSGSCHVTYLNVELQHFSAWFRVARVCQRQLGFLDLTLELGYNSYKTNIPMLQQKCKEKKENYII